jgi:Zn-finger nucleic acid-binding protein/ribosomal protein L37AE/L43A
MTNCANCGAPTRRDQASGAQVCGHCGTLEMQPLLTRDIEIEATSTLPCALCMTPLSYARLDGYTLFYCRSCTGMLVPMDHFVNVTEAARLRENQTGVSLPRRQHPGERVLTCPACAAPMLSHFYAGPGNLVIDTCERCHVNWLDPGELRRIARAPHGRSDQRSGKSSTEPDDDIF